MHALKMITYILVLAGALNWGIVGLINVDLVSLLFGEYPIFAKIFYLLVGLSAIIYISLTYKNITHKDC